MLCVSMFRNEIILFFEENGFVIDKTSNYSQKQLGEDVSIDVDLFGEYYILWLTKSNMENRYGKRKENKAYVSITLPARKIKETILRLCENYKLLLPYFDISNPTRFSVLDSSHNSKFNKTISFISEDGKIIIECKDEVSVFETNNSESNKS